jgi:hypothetical protein
VGAVLQTHFYQELMSNGRMRSRYDPTNVQYETPSTLSESPYFENMLQELPQHQETEQVKDGVSFQWYPNGWELDPSNSAS